MTPTPNRTPSSLHDRGERVYRLLLRLYPAAFRARFGEEMLDFFRERRRAARISAQRSTVVRMWLVLLADVARSAPAARWTDSIERRRAESLPIASSYPEHPETMDALLQDLRFAFRTIRKRPAFAAVAVLTLALGIGANTAIFSVVHAVLLRQLPWPDAERIVLIYPMRGGERQRGSVYLDYLDWRAQSTSFADLGVLRGQSVNLTGRETPERVIGSFVNSGAMRILRASTTQGRLFTDAETEVATRQPVAVVSDALWRTRLGARPDIIGSTLVFNGTPCTVIGVMRPDYTEPFGPPEVWLPIGYYPNAGDLVTRGRPGVAVLGRLKPGVTLASAQRELNTVAARIAAAFPATNAGVATLLRPVSDDITSDARAPLYIVLSAVGIVLLIACANLANLQLVRAASRRRELSVRAALGAARGRLVRQLATESALLALAGGALGLLLAWWSIPPLTAALPRNLPLFDTVRLEPPVLAFAACVTMIAGIIFGGVPAIGVSRGGVSEALTTRGGGDTRQGAVGRRMLVAAQVALSVVLLVSAGLLTRSLLALGRVQPGFDAEHLLTLQFRLPVARYPTERQIAAMFDRAIAEIRAVPGVRAAALVRATPLNGNGETVPYSVDGRASDPRTMPSLQLNIVSPGYFETMRIPRVAGRDFDDGDRDGTLPVAMVNDVLARRAWPNESPIGKRLRLGTDSTGIVTVIGVVAGTKHFALAEPPLEQAYVSYEQRPLVFTEVVVRGTGDPLALATPVREAIWRVDRDQPVWGVRSMSRVVDIARGGPRLTVGLMSAFGLLALVLSALGVYGVTSYAVAARTREVGIRMALGARRAQVLGMVLREGMTTIVIALVVGLVAALAAARLLATQLFGVGTADPATLAAVALVLGVVALGACWLPARRASHVDPLIALRSE